MRRDPGCASHGGCDHASMARTRCRGQSEAKICGRAHQSASCQRVASQRANCSTPGFHLSDVHRLCPTVSSGGILILRRAGARQARGGEGGRDGEREEQSAGRPALDTAKVAILPASASLVWGREGETSASLVERRSTPRANIATCGKFSRPKLAAWLLVAWNCWAKLRRSRGCNTRRLLR